MSGPTYGVSAIDAEEAMWGSRLEFLVARDVKCHGFAFSAGGAHRRIK